MRATVLGVSAAIFLAGAGTARAAQPEIESARPVRFALALKESTVLEACGGARALGEAVDERLHRPAFGAANDADITLVVDVDARWNAHIVERDRSTELGRRDVPLAPDDCAKSVATLAVVLAITIGPPRVVADDTPKPAPAGPPPPPPPPPVSPAAPPRQPSALELYDESARWRLSPIAELVGGTGVLPHLAFGVQAGAIVRPPVRRLSFIARASYWPARSTDTAAAAEVDRAGLAVLGCASLLGSVPASLGACAGVDAGRLHSTSIALTRSSETAVFLDVFAEGRLGYRLPLSRAGNFIIEPLIAAQIAAVLRRDRFTYRDRTGQELTLLQPSPVAFQASFGLAVHFL